eukprot:435153-Hanusia_phi.AAC.1
MQLLRGFFRPEERGRHRMRQRSDYPLPPPPAILLSPTYSDNKRSLQPILLGDSATTVIPRLTLLADSSCLDFSDKLGIEPPVSDGSSVSLSLSCSSCLPLSPSSSSLLPPSSSLLPPPSSLPPPFSRFHLSLLPLPAISCSHGLVRSHPYHGCDFLNKRVEVDPPLSPFSSSPSFSAFSSFSFFSPSPFTFLLPTLFPFLPFLPFLLPFLSRLSPSFPSRS